MRTKLYSAILVFLTTIIVGTFPCRSAAQSAGKNAGGDPVAVHVWQDTMEIPTYEEGLPDENPPFDQFVTNGRYNYPYTIRENLTNRVAPRKWRTLNLENEYLKCVILPDLGGHLYRCIDKRNGADLFYANPSLKFARIAYRGVWAAYGIEFNFPVSHNWMTASPVDFSTSTSSGWQCLRVGQEHRPRLRHGMAGGINTPSRPDGARAKNHALQSRCGAASFLLVD